MKRAWAAAVVAAGLIAACATAMPTPVQIKALDWVSPQVDQVAALTTQPATCLRATNDNIRAGEVLFNSPLLLGGQAAKAGLSCGSCHQNGRGNPNFAFSSISGTPGTADITHGLFSRVRADETFNPVPIPDLATPDGRSRVDRTTHGSLESFLEAQITEEFEGAAPTEAMTDALASYIRALDDQACAPGTRERLTWQREISLISVGLKQIDQAPPGDTTTRRAYVNAIRASLGRLHERYTGVNDIQASLIQISLLVRETAPSAEIEAALNALKPELAEQAARSLYDPESLSRTLAAGAD